MAIEIEVPEESKLGRDSGWWNPDVAFESSVGRAAAFGALIGMALFTVVVGGACLLLGLSFVTSLGLGAFTALWGGLGFGAMAGGVTAFNREGHES